MSRLDNVTALAEPDSNPGQTVLHGVSVETPCSSLFVGHVRHRRFEPVRNDFTYSGFWLYLDLAELDEVFRGRWLWSTHRAALMRFRREDHLLFPDDVSGTESSTGGNPTPREKEEPIPSQGKRPVRTGFGELPPLDDSVRSLIEASTGRRPSGPIRLLTQLRCFGYLMNPVSFYYCFDEADSCVEAVVAEVNNTPWGERHCYVLDAQPAPVAYSESAPAASIAPFEAVRTSPASTGFRHLRFEHQKRFHVSPFMQMNMNYRWKISHPAGNLTVHIENWQSGRRLFDCTFHLKRRPITGGQLAGVLLRHPFMTGKFLGAIYWQALKLWWKRCPFIPHPNSKIQEASES